MAQTATEDTRVWRGTHRARVAAREQMTNSSSRQDDEGLRATLRRLETELILDALREAGWNQTKAARRLGLPRRTLVHKLRKLGIAKLGYGKRDG